MGSRAKVSPRASSRTGTRTVSGPRTHPRVSRLQQPWHRPATHLPGRPRRRNPHGVRPRHRSPARSLVRVRISRRVRGGLGGDLRIRGPALLDSRGGRGRMLDGVHRPEFADFPRRCHTRLAPAGVRLADGARRRTPGPRREEVPQPAGMSVDHYTRLEQARVPRPSRQMLTAPARAPRMTEDERDHLLPPGGGGAAARGGRQRVRTPRAAARTGPAVRRPGPGGHRPRRCPRAEPDGRGPALATCRRARRGCATRCGGCSPIRTRASSSQPGTTTGWPATTWRTCGRCWPPGPTARARPRWRPNCSRKARCSPGCGPNTRCALRRVDVERFRHPVVGELELDCEVLLSPEHDQRLIGYSARPGGDSYERLRLLRVVGLQDGSES